MSQIHAENSPKHAWYQYILRVLLPPFSELQLIMLLASGLAVVSINREAAQQAAEFLMTGNGFMTLLAGTTLFICLLSSEKLSEELKTFSCVIYYGFLAIGAHYALTNRLLELSANSIVETINTGLMYAIFGTAIIRGIVTLFAARVEITQVNQFMARNFDDTQHQFRTFALASVWTGFVTVIAHQLYGNPLAAILIGFTYANISFTLLVTLRARQTQAHRFSDRDRVQSHHIRRTLRRRRHNI